jgi:hypothetical protein
MTKVLENGRDVLYRYGSLVPLKPSACSQVYSQDAAMIKLIASVPERSGGEHAEVFASTSVSR